MAYRQVQKCGKRREGHKHPPIAHEIRHSGQQAQPSGEEAVGDQSHSSTYVGSDVFHGEHERCQSNAGVGEACHASGDGQRPVIGSDGGQAGHTCRACTGEEERPFPSRAIGERGVISSSKEESEEIDHVEKLEHPCSFADKVERRNHRVGGRFLPRPSRISTAFAIVLEARSWHLLCGEDEHERLHGTRCPGKACCCRSPPLSSSTFSDTSEKARVYVPSFFVHVFFPSFHVASVHRSTQWELLAIAMCLHGSHGTCAKAFPTFPRCVWTWSGCQGMSMPTPPVGLGWKQQEKAVQSNEEMELRVLEGERLQVAIGLLRHVQRGSAVPSGKKEQADGKAVCMERNADFAHIQNEYQP